MTFTRAGSARRRHDGRADRAAPRQRRRAGRCCSTSRARRRAPASTARAQLKPDPQFTPDTLDAGAHRQLRRRPRRCWPTPTGCSRRSSSGLDVKRDLLAQVVAACRADAVLSTNTSGIPVGAIAEGWPIELRAAAGSARTSSIRRATCTCSSSFPRPTPIRPSSSAWRAFGDRVLGKGVVVAKDTPNFIGNHLALHGVAAMLRAVDAGRYTIDEVDAITGAAIGRPGSATFRTMDIAGLDVLAHVMRNLEERLPVEADRAWFAPSPLLQRLHRARARSARRPASGFYERRKDASGASAVFTLNPATLRLPAAAQAGVRRRSRPPRPIDDVGARVRALFLGPDRVGAVPARDAGAHAALRRPCGAGHRAFDRRRRPRDALGLRLGTRPVRAARRDRPARGGGGGRRAAASHDVPPAIAEALAAGRNRLRDGALRPAGPGLLHAHRAPSRSSQVVKTERRGQPGGSRRRRAGRAVPLEDERHRRRHHRDAPRRASPKPRRTSARWSSATRRPTSRPAPT